MADVFAKLLSMSMSASWLVLAVIAARFVLRRAPKALRCLLWALVAVKLLCPFAPESRFSLIPSNEAMAEAIFTPAAVTREGTNESTPAAIAVSEDVASLEPGHDFLELDLKDASILWLGGMGLMLLYAAESYRRIHKQVEASISLGNGVFICDYVDSPFVLGLIKPRIYLPSTLKVGEADHVLAHERAHIQRMDHWWKPLGYVLLALHWFNPLIWAAYILLCKDIELACDERVVRTMGLAEKKSYSEALLSCSVPRHRIAACPLAFGEVGVKERVKNVLTYKKPVFWVILASLAVCAAVAVCFLTEPRTEPDTTVYQDDASTLQVSEPRAEPDTIVYQDDASTVHTSDITLDNIDWDTTVLDGVATLAEQSKLLICHDLQTHFVTFFDPYVYGDILIVGCEYNGKYGAAYFEKNTESASPSNGQYRLRQTVTQENLLDSGYQDVGIAEFSVLPYQLQIFLCKNVLLYGLEWTGGYQELAPIGDHPSLVVTEVFRWQEGTEANYRFLTEEQYREALNRTPSQPGDELALPSFVQSIVQERFPDQALEELIIRYDPAAKSWNIISNDMHGSVLVLNISPSGTVSSEESGS